MVSEESWRESTQGLGARDLAMNVVLPELDGRIHSRAISFKSDSFYHEATQSRVVTYKPLADRVELCGGPRGKLDCAPPPGIHQPQGGDHPRQLP